MQDNNPNARTENVFKDGINTDGRQDANLERPSRFRPTYRNLTQDEKDIHDAIKQQAQVLEVLFQSIPQGRETSLAMTKLEESIMWAVKGLTA